MTTQAIFADRAFTPFEEIKHAVVVVEGSTIVSVGRRDSVDVPAPALRREMPGLIIVPGFVDVHTHGAAGHDVMEGSAAALTAVTQFALQHGTTSIVATTVTASEQCTCRAAAGIAQYMKSQANDIDGAVRAQILGIHFEGPFISAARRGVHPAEWIAAPSVALFERLLAAADGAGVIMTLAPELPGALELIDAARKIGVVVSLGHTDATYAEARAAIERGARHATHVFNAMRPFAHRETGVVGAVLTAPGVTAELIADGVHVDAPAMRVLFGAKGARNVILVSDSIAATGMPDGNYRLGDCEVTVTGGVPRSNEGRLAGSTLTLDQALRNTVLLHVPLSHALGMVTANPARRLGLQGKKGTLAAGADADLTFLDSKLEICDVMVKGRWARG